MASSFGDRIGSDSANQQIVAISSRAASPIFYAADRTSVVDQFVADMKNAVLTLVAPSITPEFPTGGAAPTVTVPVPPTLDKPVWVSPAIPAAFTEVLDITDLGVEPFDEDPPVLQFGSAPAPFDGAMPDAPGINLAYEDPTLVVNMPPPPSLLTINVGKFSGMTIPDFSEDAPELTLVAPDIREYIPGKQYTSALLTALQTTLEERITNGGTGLNQDVENAIWDRGREREARAQAEALAQLDRMEALGYALPPGIYTDARIKIITETDAAQRGHSREVMVKSAELELDNVKHALTTATQLEGQLIDYTNDTEQRLFESTRYATEAGVSIYNAKVQAYAAMVDVYRAKVQAYEARVRAETAKVDAYRAEVAAEEAKAQVNRALVEQYRAQIDAALSAIEVYKAQIAGIQAKADIERTKVMIFGEQVRGYVAQINAYTAGVEGFRATLQAEQTKQQAYQSKVDAFAARVNASARLVDARVAAYRGRIEAKNAQWDGYRATVQGEASRVEAIARTSGAVADVYRAEVSGVSAYNDLLTKQWQVALEQSQRTAEIGVSAAKANAELYVTTRSLALDAAKTGAQVAAQLGAAALNSVNYSHSVSASNSYSGSDSTSSAQSISESTSTNYNFNV